MEDLSAPSLSLGAFSESVMNHFLPWEKSILDPSLERRKVVRPPYTGLPPSTFSSSFSVLRFFSSKRETLWGGCSSNSA